MTTIAAWKGIMNSLILEMFIAVTDGSAVNQECGLLDHVPDSG